MPTQLKRSLSHQTHAKSHSRPQKMDISRYLNEKNRKAQNIFGMSLYQHANKPLVDIEHTDKGKKKGWLVVNKPGKYPLR